MNNKLLLALCHDLCDCRHVDEVHDSIFQVLNILGVEVPRGVYVSEFLEKQGAGSIWEWEEPAEVVGLEAEVKFLQHVLGAALVRLKLLGDTSFELPEEKK